MKGIEFPPKTTVAYQGMRVGATRDVSMAGAVFEVHDDDGAYAVAVLNEDDLRDLRDWIGFLLALRGSR
jgi:hypothetical protein